ncbi:unnamed protein product [Tilletia controversa]|uniref:Myb/SANT-like domain-containing protein n=3 Tax=Tilletia TaxID=13289 RepID=A0A8X7MNT8_9BASI|nr:hypothetical protein CF336_g8289 [Tilletia laevis]KAE8191191.1 hypothetical protein CF328_g5755 [Tilletia controversa]CAD6944510.1 unnamed protein product [Tilletia caries]KAE8243290.1 hypothetical protein A4X06_0g6423 [Tilletia controversa]CAD6919597.1 unnamed protein product [Tilletia laevis]
MWKEVKELINLSGFGWDETGKRVTAEEDVWDELVKRQPKFKRWRDKTFVHYERVDALATRSTATGSFARDGKGKEKRGDTDGAGDETGSEDEDEDEDEEEIDDDNDVVTPSRKRKRPSAVSAIADIAVALKDLGSQDEGLGDALTELLERDSDVFNEDQLALLGLALADKPRLASVYRSYATRPELRRNFLQKVLDTNP